MCVGLFAVVLLIAVRGKIEKFVNNAVCDDRNAENYLLDLN